MRTPRRSATSASTPICCAQAFGQRRKQLRNSLEIMHIESLERYYGPRRAEELAFTDYVFMANELARERRR